jgi:methane/ammonia monooxygenase subunit B
MAHVLAAEPLAVEPSGPIAPGETKTVRMSATDPAWETERLALLINDPDSRFGGLLMFYDARGGRRIVSIGGTLIPQFKQL